MYSTADARIIVRTNKLRHLKNCETFPCIWPIRKGMLIFALMAHDGIVVPGTTRASRPMLIFYSRLFLAITKRMPFRLFYLEHF